MAQVARSVDFNVKIKNLSAVTVGTSAVNVQTSAPDSPVAAFHYVLLQAATTNTAIIFIGVDNTVAATSNTANYELLPGREISLPVKDVTQLWAISTAASQTLKYFLV